MTGSWNLCASFGSVAQCAGSSRSSRQWFGNLPRMNFFSEFSYGILEGNIMGVFPKNLIWNACAPTEVSICAWKSWWDKMLMLDQLKNRAIHLANRCYFCPEETLDHIMLLCRKIQSLWELLFAVFGVTTWVSQRPVG